MSAVATGLDACATLEHQALDGRAHGLHGVAPAFFCVSEFRRAEDAARRALHFASVEHEPEFEGTARSTLAFILCDSGRFYAALVELRKARSRFYRSQARAIAAGRPASN